MHLWILVAALIHTALGAPTELYFEFDDRATSVSASPGYFFCLATTEILTPTYTGDWCFNAATNHTYRQKIAHGRLSNVYMTLPTSPTVRADEDGVRANLSTALLESGFFLSPASVTFTNNANDSVVLNSVLTSVTFWFLLASMAVPRLIRWMMTKNQSA